MYHSDALKLFFSVSEDNALVKNRKSNCIFPSLRIAIRALQGSVANLSQPRDAPVDSQAKSDQCEPVDHANVCANSNIHVETNKSEKNSSDISLNEILYPPNDVLLNYSDAELEINCALEAEKENDAIYEA